MRRLMLNQFGFDEFGFDVDGLIARLLGCAAFAAEGIDHFVEGDATEGLEVEDDAFLSHATDE